MMRTIFCVCVLALTVTALADIDSRLCPFPQGKLVVFCTPSGDDEVGFESMWICKTSENGVDRFKFNMKGKEPSADFLSVSREENGKIYTWKSNEVGSKDSWKLS